MKTKATDKLPEIEWEVLDLLDKDVDERMEVYYAFGTSADGREYEGSAYYFCGELDEIKDIEEI